MAEWPAVVDKAPGWYLSPDDMLVASGLVARTHAAGVVVRVLAQDIERVFRKERSISYAQQAVVERVSATSSVVCFGIHVPQQNQERAGILLMEALSDRFFSAGITADEITNQQLLRSPYENDQRFGWEETRVAGTQRQLGEGVGPDLDTTTWHDVRRDHDRFMSRLLVGLPGQSTVPLNMHASEPRRAYLMGRKDRVPGPVVLVVGMAVGFVLLMLNNALTTPVFLATGVASWMVQRSASNPD